MSKKKKKMTRAQAAAARRDDVRKPKTEPVAIKDSGPVDRGNRLVIIVTVVMVVLIVVLSAVFALPGVTGVGA